MDTHATLGGLCYISWALLSSSKSIMPTGSRTFFFTPDGFVWTCEALRPTTSRVLPQPFPIFQDISGLIDAGLAPISNPIGLASLTYYEHFLDNSNLSPHVYTRVQNGDGSTFNFMNTRLQGQPCQRAHVKTL